MKLKQFGVGDNMKLKVNPQKPVKKVMELWQEDMPMNLVFYAENNEIGRFKYDTDKKHWTFEGDTDESAKLFAKHLYAHFQSIIDGDRDGLLDEDEN